MSIARSPQVHAAIMIWAFRLSFYNAANGRPTPARKSMFYTLLKQSTSQITKSSTVILLALFNGSRNSSWTCQILTHRSPTRLLTIPPASKPTSNVSPSMRPICCLRKRSHSTISSIMDIMCPGIALLSSAFLSLAMVIESGRREESSKHRHLPSWLGYTARFRQWCDISATAGSLVPCQIDWACPTPALQYSSSCSRFIASS